MFSDESMLFPDSLTFFFLCVSINLHNLLCVRKSSTHVNNKK
jgi:hypothetical protein